jgi:uncharacterized membrane protein YcaP (DUF421 family)
VSAGAWFDGWGPVLRTLGVGGAAYVALVVALRVSGKRTLSKLNAFDLIVTVALGSTLATILLSKDVALVQGVAALALLIAMQYAVAWLQLRSPRVRSLVKSDPALLLYRGRFLGEALRRERVTEDEVLAAARGSGVASLAAVEAVVLETDGSLSVVRRAPDGPPSTLSPVRGYAAP